MTLYWLAGFENCSSEVQERTTNYAGIGGITGDGTRSFSYVTGANGGRALRFATGDNPAGDKARFQIAIHNSGDCVFGVAAKVNSAQPNGTPTGYQRILGGFNSDWGSNWVLAYDVTTNTLGLINSYYNTVIDSYACPASLSGDWHYYEVAYHSGDPTGTLKVWLDGVLVINYTGDSNAGRPGVDCYELFSGAISGLSATHACSCDYDDGYLISGTTPLGPIRVINIPPTGVDSNTGWVSSDSGAGPHNEYVDAVPFVATDPYLVANSGNLIELFKTDSDLTSYLGEDPIIKAVAFGILCKMSWGGMYVRFKDSGAATYDSDAYYLNGQITSKLYGNTLDPHTSSAWTVSGITGGAWGPRAGDNGNQPFQCMNAWVSVAVPLESRTLTSTTVSSSVNPTTVGSSTTLTGTIKDIGGSTTYTAATGTIQFKSDGESIGTARTVTSGVATLAYSSLTHGAHDITAEYSGDDTYADSISDALEQVVNYVATTTVVTSNLNPSTAGQEVTFTATINNSAATGTVQFKAGGVNIGVPQSVISGVATLAYSGLIGGTHSITAVYSGDTTYDISTSSGISQVVNLANTSTAIASNLNPSTYGNSVTFTATIKNAGGTSTLTGATGTVQFKADGSNIGTARTVASGVATLSYSSLGIGTKEITAVYSGDSSYSTSTGPALPQVVNKIVTRVLIASNHNPSNLGQSVTFTATIKDNTGTTTLTAATGTIQFKSNEANLGLPKTISSGVATYAIAALTDGDHNITAEYSGDSFYATDESDILVQEVSLEPLPTEETEAPATEETEGTEEFAVKVLSVICVAS